MWSSPLPGQAGGGLSSPGGSVMLGAGGPAMTEAEWLASHTSLRLLPFVRGRTTERQLRLAGCGCVRACLGRVTLAEHRLALEVAERMADGVADAGDIERGWG